jgi:hypothetical protein
LVGFADSDDEIFQTYKSGEIIGEFHLTPREVLEKHIQQKEGETGKTPVDISVISYILPITYGHVSVCAKKHRWYQLDGFILASKARNSSTSYHSI